MLNLLKQTFRLGLAVALPFVPLSALAQTGAIPFVHERISMLPSGKRVAVTFRERLCKNGECREVDAGMWGMEIGRMAGVRIPAVAVEHQAPARVGEGERGYDEPALP